MRFHATIDETEMHPEDPRRIYEIYNALCDAGLIDDPGYTGVVGPRDLMKGIKAREITKEEVLLVHTADHWDFLEHTAGLPDPELKQLSREGDSVYFNSESFFCSQLSCGGAVETCIAVMGGDVKNAIAIVRPPGHHAEPDKAMGFCLFNNVCVAARVVQKRFPQTCKKVLILDWDVHHGNGTQTAFYDDPTVMYMSIHRYQNGKFYPDGPEGNYDHCGTGEGAGMNVNIPWQTGGMGDGDYMYAFQRVIMPIALEFNPDFVIVSAGFDAAAGDTLGGCFVTPAGFAHMTHMLMCLADGKVAVCLEGGYNLQSISKSALAVTRVLMGEPPGKLHEGDVASRGAVETVTQCVIQQSRYWRSMKPREVMPQEIYDSLELPAARLNDVIRTFQATQMWEKYKMTPLKIFRDRISESFKSQVVATSDFVSKETILFLVHDPPPVTALPDPHTNRISLHNAFLVDAGMIYVHWAASRGFGVIDVNIPLGISGEDTEELCVYMWDNYIDVSDAKNIIFMGIGEAMTGLVQLLVQRDCRERVRACVSFVGENTTLRAVPPSIIIDNLPEWYFQNSRVYISSEHAVWARPKVRKKFGTLIKFPESTIHDIMRVAEKDLLEWVLCQIGS